MSPRGHIAETCYWPSASASGITAPPQEKKDLIAFLNAL